MTTTENLGLKKPGGADKVLVGDLNDNADKLDEVIGKLSELDTTAKNSLVAAINAALLDTTESADAAAASAAAAEQSKTAAAGSATSAASSASTATAAKNDAAASKAAAETAKTGAETAKAAAENASASATESKTAAAESAATATEKATAAASSATAAASSATAAAQSAASAAESVTGAVKYNAEQTLTVAQKEQAQKNIGVTYPCNPNLLDNWYFGNPVNQRGQTSYSNNTAAAVYTGDRWTVCRGNVNVNDGYVSLTNDSATTGGNAWFDQTFENSAQLQGKTLTGSALLTDGTLCSGFAVMPNVSSSGQYPTVRIYTSANIVISMQTSSESGKSIMRISTVDTSTSILAVKLELGTQQTLAHQDADGNWVLNEIPDYGEQLARCQRYLRPIVDSEWSDVNIEARYSAASQQIETKLDMRCAPMRTTPVLTIAANDNNSVLRVVAYSPTGTLISPLYVTSAQVSLSANTTSATYADLRITNPFDTASFSEVSIDGYGIITKVFLSAEL